MSREKSFQSWPHPDAYMMDRSTSTWSSCRFFQMLCQVPSRVVVVVGFSCHEPVSRKLTSPRYWYLDGWMYR